MKNWGFTLVEILIAVAIIGLLAAGALTSGAYRAQIYKARDGKRRSDLKKMQNILEDYYNDNNQYPEASAITCGASLSPYLGMIPCEPQKEESYLYLFCNDGQAYLMFTNLDYEGDPAIASGDCAGGCEVGSLGTYNFGVSSSDIALTDVSNCDVPSVPFSECEPSECASVPPEYCDTSQPVCCPGSGYTITCNDGEILCCPIEE